MKRSIVALVALAVLGSAPALAKRVVVPKPPKYPKILAAETPIGIQRGRVVVIPFRLYDPRRILCDVEAQYGFDKNGDGLITDGTEPAVAGVPLPNEYTTATEARTDLRGTRRRTAPRLFKPSGDIGAMHSFVWNNGLDVPVAKKTATDYLLTPQGRRVPDLDHPGSFLLATGPDGESLVPGVTVRFRAKPRRGRVSAWTSTNVFEMDNTSKPSMTIDAIASSLSSPSTVLVDWTAFHADSEDQNGDGVLDIAGGEDENGDGKLYTAPVGVAFDWHVFVPGAADPSTMTPAQLAALTWTPCTRAPGVGETDRLESRIGVPVPSSGELAGVATAPPGIGRNWVFAWDTAADVSSGDAFILRATPFDSNRNQGPTVYSAIVVRPGQ